MGIGNVILERGGRWTLMEKKEHIHRGLVRIKGHQTQRNQGGSKACGRRWMNANCNNHKRNRMKSGQRVERKGLPASHILHLVPFAPSLSLLLLIAHLSLFKSRTAHLVSFFTRSNRCLDRKRWEIA